MRDYESISIIGRGGFGKVWKVYSKKYKAKTFNSWQKYLIKRKKISLGYLQTFVLDEADEMLSKGFLDTIREIISLIPTTTKILLFSATMPRDIVELTTHFMKEPAKILVKNEELTLEGIKQYYVYLKSYHI